MDREPISRTLRGWAERQPDKTVYTWLDGKGREETRWSYRDLLSKAYGVCNKLIKWKCVPGDRVCLMYMPGMDFCAAFWGCLFAGVIAVPVYPVDLRKFEQGVERFKTIVAACQPKLVLTHSEYKRKKRMHSVKNMFGSASWPDNLDFETTDDISASRECKSGYEPKLDDVAFLQFTSGSTGDPKGVMLSHGNLAHNVSAIMCGLGTRAEHYGVSWVPQYHDMGLIGVLLQCPCAGASGVLMSPATMITNPLVWLKACDKYRAHQTCGMNGMYQHAVNKISDAEANALDLSSVQVYMSGGEPVRASTAEAFATKFLVAGLSEGASYPCFGMAENAVYVTGRSTELKRPTVLSVHKAVLEQGQVKLIDDGSGHSLVGCGVPGEGIGIRIVDAEALTACGPDQVGEIWVSGPSKAQGYWGRPEQSIETFRAVIDGDTSGTEYLRTGDLGFLHEGELFVCGRLKDLIIVRGRNLYPQDIERTVETSHPLVRPGCVAAFSVEFDDEEQLVVAAEVRGDPNKATRQQMLNGVRAAISVEHAVHCHSVLLLKERTALKTTSGKIRRKASKSGFLEWWGMFQSGKLKKGGILSVIGYDVTQPAAQCPHAEERRSTMQPSNDLTDFALQTLQSEFNQLAEGSPAVMTAASHPELCRRVQAGARSHVPGSARLRLLQPPYTWEQVLALWPGSESIPASTVPKPTSYREPPLAGTDNPIENQRMLDNDWSGFIEAQIKEHGPVFYLKLPKQGKTCFVTTSEHVHVAFDKSKTTRGWFIGRLGMSTELFDSVGGPLFNNGDLHHKQKVFLLDQVA